MLDRSAAGSDPDHPEDPDLPEDDDARDRRAAAAPFDAVRALVTALDEVPAAVGGASWQVLVTALRSRAGELALTEPAAWRLAAGSAVPPQHWTGGAWAAALRTALLADGFSAPAADRAVVVVLVHLLRTCPAGEPAGAEDPPPLAGYPVLSRLRPRLSAEEPDAGGSADGLLALVAALRG